MIPLIKQALVMGYTAAQVLGYVAKKMPKLEKGLKNAKESGFSDEKVLQYLGSKLQSKNPEASNKYSNQLDAHLTNSGILDKEERAAKRNQSIKTAMNIGATAFTAYTAYKGYGDMADGLKKVLGDPGGGPEGPEVGKQVAGQAAAPVQQALGMGEQQPQPGQPPIPTDQPPQPEQPPVPIAEDPRLKTLFIDRNKLGNRLLTMKKAGKSKGEMVDFLKKKIPLVQQEYIRTIGDTGEPGDLNERLEEMVDAYFPQETQGLQAEEAQGLQGQEGQIPEESGVLTAEPVQEEPVPIKEEEVEVEPFKPQEAKPIGKGSEVLTGQGEKVKVKGVSGDNLLVEKDGVIKQVKADEVIDNPIGDKELTKLYDDLISGMEKHSGKEISKMVNLAGYDKEANELTFTGHTGATYAYDNIPKWAVDELDELLVRKTSGESIVGMWEKGTDSVIGARMSKLIQRLKKERREGGQMEYSKKYEQIYDAFAPVKDAKKRILKAKSEEKARLKKELREDEKRRKKAAKK